MNVREKLLEELENNNSDLSDADLSTSPNTYREQKVVNKEREFRKRHKDFTHIYCGNCGNLGHTYRRCKFPITSCGVILYRINPEWKEEVQIEKKQALDKFCYLLIQRKDTLGYVEFMRGKYDELNKDYIITLLETMTQGEVENIKKYSFDELWNMLWLNKNIKQYQTEYEISKRKFNNLMNNKYFIFEKLIEDADIIYTEKEWGFPKGRRNLRETDYNCALREFEEETNFKKDDYSILRNIKPVEEIFYGSNNIKYKHIYYIAKCIKAKNLEIDPSNYYQFTEVSNLSWFTLTEALEKIRPYNIAKKDVLVKVNKLLFTNNC
jgi:8-oxo-dGTP pyrophosphatase MutT (NUDIX family)